MFCYSGSAELRGSAELCRERRSYSHRLGFGAPQTLFFLHEGAHSDGSGSITCIFVTSGDLILPWFSSISCGGESFVDALMLDCKCVTRRERCIRGRLEPARSSHQVWLFWRLCARWLPLPTLNIARFLWWNCRCISVSVVEFGFRLGFHCLCRTFFVPCCVSHEVIARSSALRRFFCPKSATSKTWWEVLVVHFLFLFFLALKPVHMLSLVLWWGTDYQRGKCSRGAGLWYDSGLWCWNCGLWQNWFCDC